MLVEHWCGSDRGKVRFRVFWTSGNCDLGKPVVFMSLSELLGPSVVFFGFKRPFLT